MRRRGTSHAGRSGSPRTPESEDAVPGPGANDGNLRRVAAATALAAGLTQERLAERSGISTTGVAALEAGRRKTPRLNTIGLLADALKLGSEQHSALIAAATQTEDNFTVLSPRPSAPPPQRSGRSLAEPSPGPGPGGSFVGRQSERRTLHDALPGVDGSPGKAFWSAPRTRRSSCSSQPCCHSSSIPAVDTSWSRCWCSWPSTSALPDQRHLVEFRRWIDSHLGSRFTPAHRAADRGRRHVHHLPRRVAGPVPQHRLSPTASAYGRSVSD